VTKRAVIVNADDFGQSHGVNRGVAQAYEQGILTSASLMVRYPAASKAVEYARDHPALGVGLHLDLGEWLLQEGRWIELYKVTDLSDTNAVRDELERQLEKFYKLLKRSPTHIDSHQHKHLQEPFRSIVCEAADRLNIAIRAISVPYCGRFYGQDENGVSHPDRIGVPAFIEILNALGAGVTEIACHPATFNDLNTMYGGERLTELATLCDPRVREEVTNLQIALVSFGNRHDAA
jgi:predicted glycoside hydrolase/deacetylase ChbG (UPF0249 family)